MGSDRANLISVGAITGAFGVNGEVRLKSFCAKPDQIEEYSPLLSHDQKRAFHVTLTQAIKGGFAARVKGVRFKDEADALRGTELFVERAKLPTLPSDEYYHTDLIGLKVLDTGGAFLGTIKTILDHGAGDILEITCPGQSAAVLLPFTKSAVPTVDISAGSVIVDPPEGVFHEK